MNNIHRERPLSPDYNKNIETKKSAPERNAAEIKTIAVVHQKLQEADPIKAAYMETRSIKEFSVNPEISGPKLNFSSVPLKINIAEDLKLSPEAAHKLEEGCINDYKKAMEVLEESIAFAACSNPCVIELIGKACERLLTVIDTYAEVLRETSDPPMKPLQSELLVYKLLSDSFFSEATKKTKDYAGNVGSNPLAIRDALKEGNLRERLFLLINFRKSILRTIIKDPMLVDKINQKLQDSRMGWQIEADPSFDKDGLYAAETDTMKLRKQKDHLEEWKKKHAPTIESGEKLLIKPSKREERYAAKEPLVTEKHKTQQFDWSSGSALYEPVTAQSQPENPYLKIADDLKLTLIAGISGTTDHILTCINRLGLNSMEDMNLTRLACLGLFIDTKCHSAYEVMTSSKSFGLEFKPSTDYYNQIDPLNTGFLEDLKRRQKEKGFELPDYYLSEEHAKKKAKELR